MRKNDLQLGTPQALYTGSKAAIEALSGVPEGGVAYATDTNEFGSYDGSAWTWGQNGGGGSPDWGDIGGTLSDQTDLQAALDAKLNDSQIEDAVTNGVTDKAPTENAVYDALAAVAAATQPLDADLTAIAALSPADDDIIQRKAGAWTFRTVAQYIVDLGLGSLAFLSSLAHSSLTGIGTNDHHNQSHDHSASGDGQALAPASTFALTGDITPSTLSGDVNDYDPTGWSTAAVIRLESESPSVGTITGLAGGADGRVAILINKGDTFNVNLASESASSSAANRFSFGSSVFQLAPGRAIALIYDSTASRWRPLVIHDHTQLSNIGNYAHSVLDIHRDDIDNPHSTTALQAGALPSDGWIAGTGTWSYTSADAPVFVASVPDADAALINVGNKIKLTQTTAKYFIVVAKGSPSGGFTPVTIYGGTDYTLANAAITLPFFSHSQSPLTFPMAPDKWTVTVTDTSDRTQATPTQNTWYNLGSISISIPIGCWSVNYKVLARPADNPNTLINQYSTLSTANNSESDADFTALVTLGGASGSLVIVATQHCLPKILTLAAKTSYYLNAKTSIANLDSIAHRGDAGTTVVKAVCAYL